MYILLYLSIYNYDGCIVHHVGRMGEGHYIATVLRSATTTTTLTNEEEKQGGATGGTAEYKSNNNGATKRDNNSNKNNNNNKNTSPSKNKNNKDLPLLPTLPIQQGGGGEGEEWICYNDNSVTTIELDEIICSSSAYVLFYIRKDMKSQTIETLFPPSTTSPQASPSRAGVAAGTALGGGVVRAPSSSSTSSPNRKPTPGPGEARGSILSLVGAKNPLTPLRSLGSKQTSNNSLNDSEHTTNDSNNIKLPKPRNRLPSTREGDGGRPISMSTSPPSSASAGGGSGGGQKKGSATGHNSTQHTHTSGGEEGGDEKGGQSSGCQLS